MLEILLFAKIRTNRRERTDEHVGNGIAECTELGRRYKEWD